MFKELFPGKDKSPEQRYWDRVQQVAGRMDKKEYEQSIQEETRRFTRDLTDWIGRKPNDTLASVGYAQNHSDVIISTAHALWEQDASVSTKAANRRQYGPNPALLTTHSSFFRNTSRAQYTFDVEWNIDIAQPVRLIMQRTGISTQYPQTRLDWLLLRPNAKLKDVPERLGFIHQPMTNIRIDERQGKQYFVITDQRADGMHLTAYQAVMPYHDAATNTRYALYIADPDYLSR